MDFTISGCIRMSSKGVSSRARTMVGREIGWEEEDWKRGRRILYVNRTISGLRPCCCHRGRYSRMSRVVPERKETEIHGISFKTLRILSLS